MPRTVKNDKQRGVHQDISGDRDFAATDVTTTLVAGKSKCTIVIQRIIVTIKTDAAQSWTFQDSNGSAVYVAKVTTSPGADTRWDFDFGPEGKGLTEAKDFVLTMSAAGLAGHVEWLGFLKLTSTVDAATFATL